MLGFEQVLAQTTNATSTGGGGMNLLVGSEVEIIVFVAAVIGTFAATMIPYWSKIRENPELAFEKKFLGTAVVSFVTSIAIGIGLFPALIESVDPTTGSLAAIFATTALAAFGLTRGMNMAMPSGESATTATTATTTTPTTPT